MEWDWELVAGPFDRLTEGPAWDGKALLFTHIPASRIMSYDPMSGESTVYRDDTNHTNGLAFDANSNLYGCCSGGRSIVRFESDGSTTTIADRLDGQRLNTPNDLAIDRLGPIWFSNPWNAGNIDPSEQQEMAEKDILQADPQPDGSWTCKRMTYDTTGTNGLLISPDQRSLYIIQTDNEPGAQVIPHPGRRLTRSIYRAAPVRNRPPGTPASYRRYVFGLRGQHRRHCWLVGQRSRPHDLHLDARWSRPGDPPNASGRGQPYQLHLWGS